MGQVRVVLVGADGTTGRDGVDPLVEKALVERAMEIQTAQCGIRFELRYGASLLTGGSVPVYT